MSQLPPIALSLGARVRPSPFFESTVEHGVSSLTVYNHMMLPVTYEGVEEEYRHLVEDVAVWDVGAQRQVEITGSDAARFTQYLVTRDVTRIAPGQARYTLVCQEDGGVLNDPVLLRLAEDHFWLSLADSDILLWARGVAHGSAFDVDITEPDVAPLQVQGPRSADLMRTLLGPLIDGLGFYRFLETELDGVPLVVSRTGWSGEHGYEIFLRDSSQGAWLWQRLFDVGEPWQVRAGAPNNIRRIESGMLSYGTDMDSTVNPLELGLERFVDLDGPDDFIGKEALRRVAAGGVSRRLVGLYVPGEPIRQAPIRRWPIHSGERTVGHVTSAAWSPGLERNLALALLAVEAATPGRSVHVETPTGDREATIVPLPFVEPRY